MHEQILVNFKSFGFNAKHNFTKMKEILFLAILLASIGSTAQVGIGTNQPKATLDVVGKPTDAAVVDGVIAPRITGNELKAKDAIYLAPQTGAIVYATAAAVPTTAKTINVKAAGYYYFDGTVWIRIAAPAAEAVGAVKSITNLVGTTTQIVAAGSTVDVAGLSQIIIVPEGKSSILQITATGYASQSFVTTAAASQGAFAILVNGVKLTSAYVSSQDATGLSKLSTPATITTSTTLTAGTHIIKMTFKAWSSEQQINTNAVTVPYSGSVVGDEDALKSRLSIIEFNN
jgi:hypothetical protein